jgi:carbamoyl-phosphate synthase/aspartate carbamoyltransferase
VLADGSVHQGFSFGANVPVAGEVVFNTGMVGYPEALTDPSYRGQILVLTYPMVGNYGVPAEDALDEHGLPLFFESSKIQVAGLIVASYSADHSHWNSVKSLGKWLQEHGVPALYGIDTRALTKKIRETGAILGKIDFKAEKATIKAGKGTQAALEFMDPNKTNLVAQVSTKAVKVYGKGKSPRIVAFDCGMKFNIIRYFVKYHEVQFTVVPFDYDLKANPAKLEWEGIFISNGPGDPTMCEATIETLKWAMNLEHPKPIFGICLGNQLLALAAGAKTFKMKYGNRGMNQPCVDMRTTKCYITAQNHGYAVDSDGLPPDWKTFFLNANDFSNEGIIHVSKPFFSVQFHPEACGGPTDTAFLFETFISLVRGSPHQLSLLDPCLYQRFKYKKVLLVGSGGLSIGQAGEFDYSGSQAIKALKEEGIEVILINPNVATVQTSKSLGKASPDKVYFLPIRPEVVLEIIKKEKPDGIMVNVGGQTALNVGIKLWESGDLQKHNVRVMGTPIATIVATEDREIFSEKLREIDETLALSFPATSMEEAKEAAKKIGYPVLIRAAYALGGLGSGFAEDEAELVALAEKAFASSSQILIDQDLRGWKVRRRERER